MTALCGSSALTGDNAPSDRLYSFRFSSFFPASNTIVLKSHLNTFVRNVPTKSFLIYIFILEYVLLTLMTSQRIYLAKKWKKSRICADKRLDDHRLCQHDEEYCAYTPYHILCMCKSHRNRFCLSRCKMPKQRIITMNINLNAQTLVDDDHDDDRFKFCCKFHMNIYICIIIIII